MHIAYLGPRGTYTEQALVDALRPSKKTPCASIAEVFEELAAGNVDAGFVPIENVLHGPVTETLDTLLQYKGQVQIVDSFVAKISHAAGALPGTRLEQLESVYSHPQAIHQCSQFISSLPNKVKVVHMESTAEAAQRIANEKITGACAIASTQALSEQGLQILAEEIGDSSNNKTRFILLKSGDAIASRRREREDLSVRSVTSIAIEPGRDRRGLLLGMLEKISDDFDINLQSIHSRPDKRGGFIFYLDLEGGLNEERVERCIQALSQYCISVTSGSAGISVFGSYPSQPFHVPKITTVGIVGGLGRMGQWFHSFFEQAGLEVVVSDTRGGVPIKALLECSDAILISVPMRDMGEVIAEIVPLLRPGQLVIENCSIKGSSLPHILAAVPNEVEVLGIHTMFGETVTSLEGQNVIVTGTPSSGEKAKFIEDLLYKYGASLVYASADEHDKASSYVQSLVHLVLIGMAEVMRKEFNDPNQLAHFSTPNARAIFHAMERVVSQDGKLIWDLQTLNQLSAETRGRFLSVFEELVGALEAEDLNRIVTSARESNAFLSRTKK